MRIEPALTPKFPSKNTVGFWKLPSSRSTDAFYHVLQVVHVSFIMRNNKQHITASYARSFTLHIDKETHSQLQNISTIARKTFCGHTKDIHTYEVLQAVPRFQGINIDISLI